MRICVSVAISAGLAVAMASSALAVPVYFEPGDVYEVDYDFSGEAAQPFYTDGSVSFSTTIPTLEPYDPGDEVGPDEDILFTILNDQGVAFASTGLQERLGNVTRFNATLAFEVATPSLSTNTGVLWVMAGEGSFFALRSVCINFAGVFEGEPAGTEFCEEGGNLASGLSLVETPDDGGSPINETAPVPLPATLPLAAIALAGLWTVGRRRV